MVVKISIYKILSAMLWVLPQYGANLVLILICEMEYVVMGVDPGRLMIVH